MRVILVLSFLWASHFITSNDLQCKLWFNIPRGFQVTLSEAEYCANVPRLSAQLSAEHVRGVHEDALPLALNAALRLGCVVKVGMKAWGLRSGEARGRRMGTGHGAPFLGYL